MKKICLFLLMSVLAQAGEGAPRPNLVLILADDLGYADVGVHGSLEIPTPNIDRLAATGVRFSAGYSSHPFCSPMRAGLMTGRYQQRFGYLTNVPHDPQNPTLGLPNSEPTVARRLQEAGYRTGVVGKWHLGAAHNKHPNKRGFDFFYGFPGGGHDYLEVDLHKAMGEGYFQPLQRNSEPVNFQGYLTDRLAEEAVSFVERNRERPFFLFLSFNAPHTPMQAPAAYLERFRQIEDPKRRTYAAMVHAMDVGIGRVMAALEQQGLEEQTLVAFLSDNGGPTRANASSNRPLRGFKGDVFEGGIRVPFIMTWPGGIPRGATYGRPVFSLDIPVTLLAAAGVPTPDRLDGVNLLPFVHGIKEGDPHEALFWKKEGGESWAVRQGRYKLLKAGPEGGVELYDLAVDIGEQSDLAVALPDKARALQEAYGAWDRENEAARFPGFRDYHRAKNRFYRELNESR